VYGGLIKYYTYIWFSNTFITINIYLFRRYFYKKYFNNKLIYNIFKGKRWKLF